MQPPREERLSWNDHHMLLAITTADRSPDPNTQVGAIVVNHKNRIVSTGYNGTARKINPKLIDWSRTADDPCCTKYPFVLHAEENACDKDLSECTLYVTMHPCNECAKDILKAGITKVVYLTNPYEGSWSNRAAVQMFDLAQVDVVKHTWDNPNQVRDLLGRIDKMIP